MRTESRAELSYGCAIRIEFFYMNRRYNLILSIAAYSDKPVGPFHRGGMSVPSSVQPQILCRVDYLHESPVPGVHKHVHLNNVTKLWRSMNETLKPMGIEKTKVYFTV